MTGIAARYRSVDELLDDPQGRAKLGVKPETAQPVCMRVLLLPIPVGTPIRQALGACGNFAPDDASLPEEVAEAVLNDVASTDIGFVSRM